MTDMKLENYIENLKTNNPFALTRWGDGEWFNLNKKKGQNCDGNIYYEDLGDELLKIVSEKQNYHLGVQTLISYSVSQSENYPQDWVDADVFHKASSDGNLQEFIEVLENSHVVYIGNESLKNLSFVNEFIEIPYNNCWMIKDEIIKNVESTFSGKTKVYLFSAGMATNYFIHELWNKNNKNIYIDVGSVFDPYVGRITRQYHRKLKIK